MNISIRNQSSVFRRGTLRQNSKGSRKGLATVEFALIAPLFFMLILGSIEMGRGLMVQQVLTNASRVGVRDAVMLSGTTASATTAATDFAEGATVGGVTVVVTPDPSTASSGDMISLTVSVPFANVTWVPAPWFMGSTTLSATSVMRKEGFE
ncbi:TadE/TadG family type IV pilus assembly protein [Bythopirellula goksoeyrii]|uniref:TadE-like protein n=1 Tax=Bythopirellula goksoeyrii TaxID=1400387 RepID=A0A5B9QB51_9BACT|nr:TadE family protein [Bythopirellula goksoeyrii]QEG34136.1 TadE-like protein [Bythopirellula goksoeyrii]